MNVITILHISSFIANALLIIFVLSRKPVALLNRVCALLVATFACWSIFASLHTMAATKEEAMLFLNLSSFGWCFTPVATLWFYLALNHKDHVIKNKAFIAVSTLVAAGFIFGQWSGNMMYDSVPVAWGWTSIWKMSVASFAYYIYYFVIYAVCIYQAIDFGRHSKSHHQKMQAKLLIITGTIAVLLSTMTDVVFRIFDIRAIPDVADIFFMIWGFGIVYAVSKYGLMSVTPGVAAETILNTIGDSIILLDNNSQIVYTNQATSSLTGYKQNELSNVTFSLLVEDNKSAESLLKETLNAGRCVNRELSYLSRGGKIVPVLVSTSDLRNSDNDIIGIVISAKDISERKKTEEALQNTGDAYRLLADHMTDTLWMMDMDLKITWMSPSSVKARGMSMDEIAAIPPDKQATPESFGKAAILFEKMLRLEREGSNLDPKASISIDMEFYCGDGTTRWFDCTFQFIRDKQGTSTGILAQGRDITERKAAELARKESDNYYRLLAENTSDVVTIFDMNMKPVWISESVKRATGYTPEEQKNLPITRRMTPESMQRAVEHHIKNIESEKAGILSSECPFDLELEIYRKDGSTFWTENRFRFIRDGQGQAINVLMEARDISERKIAEAALQNSRDTYRLLAEHIHDVVWMMDLELNLTWVSPSSEKIRGYSPDETYALPLEKQLTRASLEKAVNLLRKWAHIEKEGRTPEPNGVFSTELEFTCKDGHTVLLECAFQFIRDGQGKATGILAEGRDITERRAAEMARIESEKNYRLLAENTTDVVTMMDMDLNITWLSPSSEKLTGFSPEVQMRLPIDKRMTQDSLLRALNQFAAELEKEKTGTAAPDRHNDIELEIYHKDGHTLWTENRIHFIRDSQGTPVSILMQGRDITTRKQAATTLQKTLADLKRSNEELERFAYVASHDLQEPLRMVSSYVQLLEKRYKDKLDNDANDFINFAVSGSRRMQNLINDLLSYSRVGTRGKPFQTTESSEALAAAVSNLDVAINEAGAVVEQGELPCVLGDEGQLVQVFQNLVGNAIKFHGDESPVVRVDAVRNDGNWVFSVKDNGIGIDQQFHERIFQVFQRLYRDEYPGTGIGLSIARKIVQRHEGQMWLESEPGKGTTFYFTIPVKEKGGQDL